jgi:hypothetical protein
MDVVFEHRKRLILHLLGIEKYFGVTVLEHKKKQKPRFTDANSLPLRAKGAFFLKCLLILIGNARHQIPVIQPHSVLQAVLLPVRPQPPVVYGHFSCAYCNWAGQQALDSNSPGNRYHCS